MENAYVAFDFQQRSVSALAHKRFVDTTFVYTYRDAKEYRMVAGNRHVTCNRNSTPNIWIVEYLYVWRRLIKIYLVSLSKCNANINRCFINVAV